MVYANGNTDRGLYNINKRIIPHKGPVPYMQKENEIFAEMSRIAEDVSQKLPELYNNIKDKTTLKTTLEQRLKQAEGVFKNNTEISVLVTLCLNNGVPFNISGDFENAYDYLHPKLKEVYTKYSNVEIREALKSLVYQGFVIEAKEKANPVLTIPIKVDFYLNGFEEHYNAFGKNSPGGNHSGNGKKGKNNHHSLLNLFHLVKHKPKKQAISR